MQIYIPKHLDKLEIVKNLKTLIRSYREEDEKTSVKNKSIAEIANYIDYFLVNSTDAILRFLEYTTSLNQNYETDDNVLKYLSAKFYQFRGTLKVFDVLKESETLLGIKIESYDYTTKRLEINIDEVNTPDITFFFKLFSAFLSNLLYYQELKESIDIVIVSLTIPVKTTISTAAIYKNTYTITDII